MNLSCPTFSLSNISIVASFSEEIWKACSSFHTGLFPPPWVPSSDHQTTTTTTIISGGFKMGGAGRDGAGARTTLNKAENATGEGG